MERENEQAEAARDGSAKRPRPPRRAAVDARCRRRLRRNSAGGRWRASTPSWPKLRAGGRPASGRRSASFEQRLESSPQRQQEYQAITRDWTAAKDLYDSLLKRYDEAQLTESMETDRAGERFRVLEPALPPEGPAAPNRMRLLIMGLLLALCRGRGGGAGARAVRHRVPLGRRGPRLHRGAGARLDSADRTDAGRPPRAGRVRDRLRARRRLRSSPRLPPMSPAATTSSSD